MTAAKGDGYRRQGRQAGRLLATSGLLLAAAGGVSAEMGVSIERIERDGWRAEGVRLDFTPDREPAARLRIQELQPPGNSEALRSLQLDCGQLHRDHELISCRSGRVSAALPAWGEVSGELRVDYRPASRKISVSVREMAVVGGRIGVQAEWQPAGWTLELRGTRLDAGRTVSRILPALPGDWTVSGELNLKARLSGEGTVPETVGVDLDLDAVDFNDAMGLRAAQQLTGSVSGRARRRGDDWVGQTELQLDSGGLYVDPVYVSFSDHPLALSGDAVIRPASTTLELLGFRISQGHAVEARGDASLVGWPPAITRARINQLELTLPGAYELYAQPWLAGTALATLSTQGRLRGSLRLRDGALTRLRIAPQAATVSDDAGRLRLDAVSGFLAWARDGTEAPPTSTLTWRNGSLYGLPLGASRWRVKLQGDDLEIAEPVRVPLLDGALRINELAVRNALQQDRRAALDATLEPVALGQLTRALGWPAFAGTLSGRLPSLSYRDGVATLGGTLHARAFDGHIAIEALRLRDPLGSRPELSADVTIEGLDMERMTEALRFGRITGRLDGYVRGLRLVDWQPAAFRAWFTTPADDSTEHRISQRAVENLASLGGSGGAAALSRGFLAMFDEFDYERLGLGCVLRGDVCVMRGLGPAENKGYYIVRGSGVPRVDVIGYVNAVSWPTLVQQITSATRSGGPVVR